MAMVLLGTHSWTRAHCCIWGNTDFKYFLNILNHEPSPNSTCIWMSCLRNHLPAFSRAFQTLSCGSDPLVHRKRQRSGGEGWGKGISPQMHPPDMIQCTDERWHEAVDILGILTCFLQGGNPRASGGRDDVHLAGCWYYDMDMYTWSLHGWACYVTGHLLSCASNCRATSPSDPLALHALRA